MKRLMPFLILIIIALLFVGFTFAPSEIREAVMSKIPLIKSFTKTTTYMRTVKVTETSVLKMKTAQYDIDFFVELESAEGKYIALYPYRVVAGIDLKDVETVQLENDTVEIQLPEPKLLFSGMSNSSDSLILRDSLKTTTSYESYFKPIKIALEEKAIDLALENGLLERCLDNALKTYEQFSKRTDSKIVAKPYVKKESVISYSASNVPASFKFAKDTFSLKAEKMPSRDDSLIYENDKPEIRFGSYSVLPTSMTYSDYKHDRKASLKDDNVMMQCSNPFENDTKKAFFFADKDGYNSCRIMTKNGNDFYLQILNKNAEEKKADLSSDLVYCGLCFESSDSVFNGYSEYQRYAMNYDAMRNSFLNKSYAAVEQISGLVINDFGISSDVEKLKSLNALLYRRQFVPVTNDESFNKQLEIAWVLLTNKLNQFDAAARKKLIDRFATDTTTRLALEVSFLEHKDELSLTEQELNTYIDDVVQTGEVITKNLYEILSPKEWRNYIVSIIKNKVDVSELYEYEDSIFLLCDESAVNLYNQKRKGPVWLKNRAVERLPVENSNLLNDNMGNIFLVFREQGFWVEYTVLVFKPLNLIVFNDFTSLVFTDDGVDIPYENIIITDGILQLGDFSYSNRITTSILSEFQKVFSNKDYYALNVSENFVSNLRNQIIEEMKRP